MGCLCIAIRVTHALISTLSLSLPPLMHTQHIAKVASSSSYGSNLARDFREACRDMKIQVPAFEQFVSGASYTEIGAPVKQIAESGARVIMLAAGSGDVGPAIKAAQVGPILLLFFWWGLGLHLTQRHAPPLCVEPSRQCIAQVAGIMGAGYTWLGGDGWFNALHQPDNELDTIAAS